ncbi:M20/M25/M40 family metallo-hydrolase [Clostridium oceanicum]|uniref:Peptidase M28 domain-containing protein n=1 Tax=Clostridium oceanicum TaxID=1543 RepID=A0ABP3UX44_9CLOT
MINKNTKKKNTKLLVIVLLLVVVSLTFIGYKSFSFNKKDLKTSSTKKLNLSDEKIMMDTINSICTTNRKIGSKNEKKACELLKKQIESYGYKTKVQKVPFDDFDENGKTMEETQNLIATKKSSSKHSKGTIIISAHYDCTEDSVGANDNGSGIAVTMEIARLLKESSSNYDLEFIFFGGEELGSIGSSYYIENLSAKDKKNIKADINIDSVAQKKHSNPCIFTVNGKENFATKLLKNSYENKHLKLKEMNRERSDYVGFDRAKIPALCIGQTFDKTLNINGSKDKISIIDKKKLKLIADMVVKALYH